MWECALPRQCNVRPWPFRLLSLLIKSAECASLPYALENYILTYLKYALQHMHKNRKQKGWNKSPLSPDPCWVMHRHQSHHSCAKPQLHSKVQRLMSQPGDTLKVEQQCTAPSSPPKPPCNLHPEGENSFCRCWGLQSLPEGCWEQQRLRSDLVTLGSWAILNSGQAGSELFHPLP